MWIVKQRVYLLVSHDDIAEDVDRDGKDDGAVVFCGDAAQGLKITQLMEKKAFFVNYLSIT